MRTVYKFSIERNPDDPKCTVVMPKFAEIVHFDEQHGRLYLWALVEPKNPRSHREFELYETGHQIPEMPHMDLHHISTLKLHGGMLMLHLFERKIPES